MVEDKTLAGRMFGIINYLLLTIIGLITLHPLCARCGGFLYDKCGNGDEEIRPHSDGLEL